MKVNKIEKLIQQNYNKRDKFKHITDYMAEHHTVDLDEAKKLDVSADAAMGMAIGYVMAKNKYLLIGGAIGILGTGVAIGIFNEIKKRRNTKKEEA